MRESGVTPTAVILDSRQQRFAVRLANACSNNLKELHKDSSSDILICQVARTDHEHGRTTERMSWPAPGKEPVVKTIILEDKSIAKSSTQRCAREKEAKVRAGVWMWGTDGSSYDDCRVADEAVCKHGNEWRTRRRYLSTVHMNAFDAELRAIQLALGETVKTSEGLQEHGVKPVAVCSDSQVTIC